MKIYWICFQNYLAPPSQLDLDYLQEPQQKKAQTEAAKFEEEMLKWEGLPDTSKETILYPISFPIPTELGIKKEFCPTVGYSEEKNKASGKMVLKTFYHCTICTERSQNKDSMYNHTMHHLNISIGCFWPNCRKKYEAPEASKNMFQRNTAAFLHPRC